MNSIINKVLFYTKIVLLLIAFVLVLYISFMRMDFSSSSLLTVLPYFIPFLVLLVLFVLDLAFDKDKSKLFYNLSCILSFIAIIIIALRSVFDKNIIQYAANINLNYFINQEIRIKLLLYLMIISNLLMIFYKKKSDNKH